jgi:tetratricopeptide (TPR) repeat protein
MRITVTARIAVLNILLLTCCLFPGCDRSPEARGARYLETGKQLLQKHDPVRAILQFKNAAKATPDNPEIYYQLGMAYGMVKEHTMAVAAFRKALEINPNYLMAQLRIAQLMAGTNDKVFLNQAADKLKELLKSTLPSSEVLNTLAFAEMKLGDTQSAIQHLDNVLASAHDLDASILMARAKLAERDVKGAEEVLKKACAENPTSPVARTVLGEFYVGMKDFASAEAQFVEALKLDPKSGPTLMDLARLQFTEGRVNEAEQNFKRLSAFQDYKSVHATFLFELGRRDEAIRELEALVRNNSNDRALRTTLVVAYRGANRMADANKILAKAIQDNPKDVDALQQLGEMAIAAGKYVEAQTDLNQVLALKSTEPEVHYLLAKLNQARGEDLTYRQELSEALRLNPNLLTVRVELAHNLLSSASGARAALDLLSAAPEFQRDSTPVLIQRNWALWTLRNLPEMRKGIDVGLARERSPELLIQDGVWKLETGNPAGARLSVEEALRLNPTDLRALETLNKTYVAQKNSPMAIQKVKEYAARQPKAAAVQDFLGVMLMAQGDLPAARAAFNAAKAADPQFVKADLSLVLMDHNEGKLDDARKRLEGVLAINANNETARLWLGNIEARKGNMGAALEQFKRVAEADPSNAQAANNLAYLLAEYNNKPEEALKYAERAVQLRPDDPSYCDTMGWILYRKGLYTQALSYLQRASANKTDVVWKYHLAMAYAKSGDLTNGRTTLQAALKINSTVPEAKMASDLIAPLKANP